MNRLPFNPEPLLACFMTKESVGSLAGDLEERFQGMWQRKGWISAALWFWFQLLLSLFSIATDALRWAPRTPLRPAVQRRKDWGWSGLDFLIVLFEIVGQGPGF